MECHKKTAKDILNALSLRIRILEWELPKEVLNIRDILRNVYKTAMIWSIHPRTRILGLKYYKKQGQEHMMASTACQIA